MNIEENAVPKFMKSRPIPFALKELVVEEIERLEGEGILKPVSFSHWASPIVIATRPDGRIRMRGYFKSTINPILENEEYPMPTAEDLFNEMQGGKRFSKIDLSRAYLQVELDEESQKYCIINTCKGLRQYTRMPYGVKPGSGIFQKLIESQLKGISKTVIKIDDVLLSGCDDDEHLENLCKVFEVLENMGVTVNAEKCRLFEKEVEYNGFIIDRNGVRTNPQKIKAVLDAPAPNNVKELQSFIGAINYYGRFIEDFASLAKPLLQKDEQYLWGASKY